MSTKRDYYEILGVSKDASDKELKTAYRKMALKFHPDQNKEKDAEEKFKEVNEAYEILSDKQKKQAYDQFGHAAFDPSAAGGGFGGFRQAGGRQSGPFSYSYSTSGSPFGNTDFGDPFDIFEQFFGGASPFGQAGGGRKPKPHYALKIDFMEAVKGTEKRFIHQGSERTVKIPAGANDGTRIQYDDFIVSINVTPHQTFKRDQYDIFVDHEIPFTLAALGGTISVPTIDEEVKLKVRPGTQPSTMIRLQGKGVPHIRGKGAGDQYVRLIVTIPKNLSREQKKILQKFEKSR